jgi:plastocyanin
MGIDPACVQSSGPSPASDAVLIADDGALQNAFVYIKDGLDPRYVFPVPTSTVMLDQKGCRYSPRIAGVQVGQPVEITNSDPTLHNVHGLAVVNAEFNEGQPMQGMRERRVFTSPEVMIHFKCDVHNWMSAYVGVLNHPYFAVTKADGTFDLPNVPPGTYTVEAWHEKFGRRTAQVRVEPRQTETASFTFAAS